jgi:branched-chain amino acid transport system substrate-binding protein
MSFASKHLIAVCALLAGGAAFAQSQGVGKDQILVGSIQDLSGPIAGFGKQARNGMLLRVDEVNEQGGVGGRKIVLKVEDSGYDPKRAVLAAQKLVNQDKIFAMVGHIGTAQNLATFPVLFDKNVISFFPLSAAREMREATPRLAKEKGASKVCAIYQDDEFGLEVLRGAEAGMKAAGAELVEKTSFKRGATDFSSQVARMKAAGCDLVVMGTIIRETIGTMAESRKIGFNPTFLGSAAAYTELIHKLGGAATNGLYATMTVEAPYTDAAAQPIRFWANKYKTKFNEDPGVFSVSGYLMMDAFIQAAQKAGANLNADSFIKAMDASTVAPTFFGSPQLTFSATKRLGSGAWRLSQIQEGRWKVVSDYAK